YSGSHFFLFMNSILFLILFFLIFIFKEGFIFMSLKNTKNNDIYDMFDFLVNFDWDKNFYKFTRDEKDMYPYSVNENEDNSVTIVHNVLGLNKEDLKLSTKIADGKGWIII